MNGARAVLWSKRLLVAVLFVAASVITFTKTAIADEHRPRVFITDSESWEMVGSAAGSGGTFASNMQGGARPQTAEIIKTFGERCGQVLVNNKQEKADYVVVLDHEGGKGYLRRRNKVAVFNREGDAVVSRSTRSLGNSVQDACEAIVADWAGHSTVAPPLGQANALVSEPPPNPKPENHSNTTTRELEKTPVQQAPTPVIAAEKTAISTSSTGVGTVSVTSDPDGAEIFIDSVGHGYTPAILKLPHGKHSIQLVRQGYRDWTSVLEVRENSIVNVTARLEK